ncbi:hypothetical protein [Candidatus Regiella insecticola]|uniref:hypothetical protein n=1 Tax=Candidatus Regiella insecticola TaxID=138073 RepID=UPI001145A37E|nr:hypothetical protein [Candidatus Regiella insecticola]
MKRTRRLLAALSILLLPMLAFAFPASVPPGCKIWMVPQGAWLLRILVCSPQKKAPSSPVSQQVTDQLNMLPPLRIG